MGECGQRASFNISHTWLTVRQGVRLRSLRSSKKSLGLHQRRAARARISSGPPAVRCWRKHSELDIERWAFSALVNGPADRRAEGLFTKAG